MENNDLSIFSNNWVGIKNPGDSLSIRVTDSNRIVAIANLGLNKYSATKYPNGTIVTTESKKKK